MTNEKESMYDVKAEEKSLSAMVKRAYDKVGCKAFFDEAPEGFKAMHYKRRPLMNIGSYVTITLPDFHVSEDIGNNLTSDELNLKKAWCDCIRHATAVIRDRKLEPMIKELMALGIDGFTGEEVQFYKKIKGKEKNETEPKEESIEESKEVSVDTARCIVTDLWDAIRDRDKIIKEVSRLNLKVEELNDIIQQRAWIVGSKLGNKGYPLRMAEFTENPELSKEVKSDLNKIKL